MRFLPKKCHSYTIVFIAALLPFTVWAHDSAHPHHHTKPAKAKPTTAKVVPKVAKKSNHSPNTPYLLGTFFFSNMKASLGKMNQVAKHLKIPFAKFIEREAHKNDKKGILQFLGVKKGAPFVNQLPAILERNFGWSTDKPSGLMVFQWKRHFYPLLTFGAKPANVLAALKKYGLNKMAQLSFHPATGNFRLIKVQSPLLGPNALTVGFYKDGQVYLSFGSPKPFPPVGNLKDVPAFVTTISKSKNGIKDWLRAGLAGKRLIKLFNQGKLDLVSNFLNLQHIEHIKAPKQVKAIIKEVAKKFPLGKIFTKLSSGLAFSKNKMEAYYGIEAGSWLAKMWGPIAPTATNQNWLPLLPSQVAWMGYSHVDLQAFGKFLNQTLSGKGAIGKWIPPAQLQKAGMGMMMLQMQSNAFGFPLNQRLKELNGQLMSGFLWSKDMKTRIKLWHDNRGFSNHVKGIFYIVGLNSPQAAKNWLKSFQGVYNNLAQKMPMVKQMLKLTASTKGNHSLTFNLNFKGHKVQPFYLIAKNNNLVFLGHSDTKAAFEKVWAGQATSFETRVKKQGSLKGWLNQIQKSSWAFFDATLLPQMIPPFPAAMPAKDKRIITKLMSVFTSFGVISSISGKDLVEGYYATLRPIQAVKKAPTSQKVAAKPTKLPKKDPGRQAAMVGFSVLGGIFSIKTYTLSIGGAIVAMLAMQNVIKKMAKMSMKGGVRKLAKTQACQLDSALDMYRIKTGNYPTAAQGLQELVKSGQLKSVPLDPWGRKFHYAPKDPVSRVSSLGADGRLGGTGANADIPCRP